MNKKVLYTAIIGGYDNLNEPLVKPNGFDFVCFTDRTDLKSNTWEIKKISSYHNDNDYTRTARKYKILPHRFLSEYDYSVWIDGNFLVVGDFSEMIDESLLKAYDHMSCFDKRNCIYQEAKSIFWLGSIHPSKSYKDDPDLIKKQMEHYIEEGYPQNNGLISSGILFRHHNNKQVINTMEDWWSEIKNGSKRDQLSCNYVCWKNNLNIKYINEDIRKNNYFVLQKHNKHKK